MVSAMDKGMRPCVETKPHDGRLWDTQGRSIHQLQTEHPTAKPRTLTTERDHLVIQLGWS